MYAGQFESKMCKLLRLVEKYGKNGNFKLDRGKFPE